MSKPEENPVPIPNEDCPTDYDDGAIPHNIKT